MVSIDTIRKALQCGQPGCTCGQPRGNVHCPGHQDATPSLAISQSNGRILVKCFGGCSQDQVISALKEKGVWPHRKGEAFSSGKVRNSGTVRKKSNKYNKKTVPPPPGTPRNGSETPPPPPGLTLAALAQAKKLTPDFLRGQGLADQKLKGTSRVVIPYLTEAGEVSAIRYRLSLEGPQRFIWRKGDRVLPYGLWRLKEIRKKAWCLLVEGESDCWTCWHHDILVIGIPGKSTFRPEWAEYLHGIQVYLWQEPDAPELPLKLVKFIPGLMVIKAPDSFKDLSQAHIQGDDIPALVERLKLQAIPAAVLAKETLDSRIKGLREAASSILASQDPLALVEDEIKTHYGGNPAPVLTVYIALTSRLLAMRRGQMPVHLLLLSQASAGKTYTQQTAQRMLPPEAVHTIDAGSPRTLIYDESDLEHRAVIFGEADSLPAGEDNPAASAIRNLLQDHKLHYQVTVKNPETGQYTVKKVEKAGPTVLLTTSTRRLGHQLDTRLFTLEVRDDPAHIREVLAIQGGLEIDSAPEPSRSLIDFQSYLQALAPWEVVVPFAPALGREIAKAATAPRIFRDFARLLSLIKSVAVLRHMHRGRDSLGRIIATPADYRTVFDLVGPMYESTLTGASEAVRQVVETVHVLGTGTTVSEISRHLNIAKASASRRVKAAMRQGWLINTETQKGRPASLELGEPLPERAGLPNPELFQPFHTVPGGVPPHETVQDTDLSKNNGYRSTVPPSTDDIYPPQEEGAEAIREVIL